VTTHYEFLASLHEVLRPRRYLEIGVQTGASMALASCLAVGVDPAGMSRHPRPNESIFTMTSDAFFADYRPETPIDLVYIDGMHLFEYALRDFLGALKYANEKTVIVFDDVLPYNAAIAAREQPPGDWTGDVWKIIPALEDHCDSVAALVDVSPTGAFVLWDFDPDVLTYMTENYDAIVRDYMDRELPQWVLDREHVESAESVLEDLRNR